MSKRRNKASLAAEVGELDNASVRAIALNQCLPVDNPVVRYRDESTCEKSAVAQPSKKVGLPWSGAGTNPAISTSEAVVKLARDPLHAFGYTDNNTANQSAVYTWAAFNTGSGIQGFSAQNRLQTNLEPFGASYTSGFAFHGPFLWANVDTSSDNYYVQCDAPPSNANTAISKLTCVCSSAGVKATDTVNWGVYRYSNGIDTLVAGGIATAAGAGAYQVFDIAVPQLDLYRVQLLPTSQDDSLTTFTFTVTQSWTCGTWCNWPLPGLDLGKAQQVQAIRITGASVKVSNQTAEQYISGSRVAVQMHQGDSEYRVLNAASASSTPYNFISAVRGADEDSFKNGYYGFLKYTEGEDTCYRNPFKFNSAGVITEAESVFPSNAGFLLLGIRAPAADARGQVTMTFNFNVEYLTLDTWTAVDIARSLPQDWSTANMIISSMQQHYDNPIHWDRILKTIGRYAGIGSKILKIIPHPAAQGASQIAGTVANVLQ